METKASYQTGTPDPIDLPEDSLEAEIFQISDLLDRIDLKLKRSAQAGDYQDVHLLEASLSKVSIKLATIFDDSVKRWRS